MKSKNVGFIGIGDMGRLMAEHLIEPFNLKVYNRTKEKVVPLIEKGAEYITSPSVIADTCQYIIVMVSNNQASKDVITGEEGILQNSNIADLNSVIINMSTITPETSKNLAEATQDAGGRYVEAPVSGTLPHAKNQELIILTAGDKKDVKEINPILELMGKKIEYFGDVEKALQVKLVINAILAVQTSILAEGLTALKNVGINEKQFLELLNNSALGNGVSKAKGSNMVNNTFDPLFRYKYIIKDLSYASEEFNKNEIKIPLTDQVLRIYQNGSEDLSDLDFSAIYKLYNSDKEI